MSKTSLYYGLLACKSLPAWSHQSMYVEEHAAIAIKKTAGSERFNSLF